MTRACGCVYVPKFGNEADGDSNPDLYVSEFVLQEPCAFHRPWWEHHQAFRRSLSEGAQ